MKKLISLMILLSLALSMVAVVPAVADEAFKEDILIFSDDFSKGLDNWSLSNAYAQEGNVLHITDNGVGDKFSIRVIDESKEATPNVYIGSYLPAKENHRYTFKFDIKHDGSANIRLYVTFHDAAKKQMSDAGGSVNASDTNWCVAQKSFVAPEGAEFIRLRIAGVTGSVGNAYVDNIKVFESKDIIEDTPLVAAIKLLAKANPGDVIEVPDGEYIDAGTFIFKGTGTEEKPVTIRAKNPGKVVLKGNVGIGIKGTHLIVEGFRMENAGGDCAVSFDASSSYCQLKDFAMLDCNPRDKDGVVSVGTLQRWVGLRGNHNKISNCYFRGKISNGVLLEVFRVDGVPDYHTIENCYFGYYANGTANGRETIRIGQSPQSLSSSFTTIQGCFFEQCNGEVETISVKSCDNYVYNNTLYNTQGAIVLRHGNNSVVKGNLIVGGDFTTRETGVRIIGENHKVYNNYFYNNPIGSNVIYVSNGNPDPLIHEYLHVKNANVYHNTIVNADKGITAGEYSPSNDNASNRIIPPEGKIYNNAIISFKGKNTPVNGDENAKDITFINNHVYGKEVVYPGGTPQGVINGQFDYKIEDGFIIPANGAGADIKEVKKAPKSPYDVIPKWVKEAYYDTGVYTFEMVENDPFNNPDFKEEDMFKVSDDITVNINGSKVKFDVLPQLINSRTMVPMRAIFETFGAKVLWDEKTATATASTGMIEVKITEDSEIAYVNGKESRLDSPAVIIDGRFLVPVRFVSESFGAKVDWIDDAKVVNITYQGASEFKGVFQSRYADIPDSLPIQSIIQSNDDGANNMKKVVDGSLQTKWAVSSSEGSEGIGVFDLGEEKTIDKIHIAYAPHATRVYTYAFYVSNDGVDYTLVVDKTAIDNKEGAFRVHELNGVKARYVKFVGYGNTDNGWNNPAEIVFSGK